MATAAFVGDFEQEDSVVVIGVSQEVRITNTPPYTTIEFEETHNGDHTMYVVDGVIYVDVIDEEGLYQAGKGGIIQVAGGKEHSVMTQDKPAVVMHVFSLHVNKNTPRSGEVKSKSKEAKHLSQIRQGSKAGE